MTPRPGATKGERQGRAAPLFTLVFYMGVIFALSHQSRPPLPEVLLAISDKVLHTAEYLPLGFLFAKVLRPVDAKRALFAWGAAILFGVTDEFHQAFVPGRDASVFDLMADAFGAGLGAWIAFAWEERRRRRLTESASRPAAPPG